MSIRAVPGTDNARGQRLPRSARRAQLLEAAQAAFVGDYLGLAALLYPGADQRVDQDIKAEGVLWERLLAPFLLAALNTRPEGGSAALAAAVVR